METITQIPLDNLRESPFNPRRSFTGLDELAASIKSEQRVHEPLLAVAEPYGVDAKAVMAAAVTETPTRAARAKAEQAQLDLEAAEA